MEFFGVLQRKRADGNNYATRVLVLPDTNDSSLLTCILSLR